LREVIYQKQKSAIRTLFGDGLGQYKNFTVEALRPLKCKDIITSGTGYINHFLNVHKGQSLLLPERPSKEGRSDQSVGGEEQQSDRNETTKRGQNETDFH